MISDLHKSNRFPQSERLKRTDRINRLFSEGKTKSVGRLRMVYCFTDEKLENHVQVLFSVPKARFRRAVDRNLLKRRMREAYRVYRHEMVKNFASQNKYLLLGIIYSADRIEPFQFIEKDIRKLLDLLLRIAVS